MFRGRRRESAELIGAEDVLSVLDRSAEHFTFPMLDNGYVYPAAARLSVHGDGLNWAIVIETFGYSPRAETPDLAVTTFASKVAHPKTRADSVNEAAYLNYLKQHPHDAVDFHWPLDADDWPEDEALEPGVTIRLRGQDVTVPTAQDCLAVGITTGRPVAIEIFELSRYFAEMRRDDVLATLDERTRQVLPGLPQVLLLDEWHHPDLGAGNRPSDTLTFRQIAEVAATGDASKYDMPEPPNTHWSNWPLGGLL